MRDCESCLCNTCKYNGFDCEMNSPCASHCEIAPVKGCAVYQNEYSESKAEQG